MAWNASNPDGRLVLVAQISDTHILSPDSDLPAAMLRADCLRRCVAAVNREAPDAVILTGDTVQHGQPDEYAWLRELLTPLQAPLYVVPGNRDDNEAMRRAFEDLPYLPDSGPFLQYAIEDFDTRLVGITPAMREGSGLVRFEQEYPDRYFDVGIAEQHAVTFAAGLACDGMKPVVAMEPDALIMADPTHIMQRASVKSRAL